MRHRVVADLEPVLPQPLQPRRRLHVVHPEQVLVQVERRHRTEPRVLPRDPLDDRDGRVRLRIALRVQPEMPRRAVVERQHHRVLARRDVEPPADELGRRDRVVAVPGEPGQLVVQLLGRPVQRQLGLRQDPVVHDHRHLPQLVRLGRHRRGRRRRNRRGSGRRRRPGRPRGPRSRRGRPTRLRGPRRGRRLGRRPGLLGRLPRVPPAPLPGSVSPRTTAQTITTPAIL